MTSKSESLSRWLTVAANLGVLAGLILLVAELRQNHDLMRAQTRHDLAVTIIDQLRGVAENPQFASVIRRGNAGEQLTPDEMYQFQTRSRTMFRYWEDVHYQYREGLYDEVEFASHRDSWAAFVGGSQGVVVVWCEIREEFSPEFRAELNGVLSTYRC